MMKVTMTRSYHVEVGEWWWKASWPWSCTTPHFTVFSSWAFSKVELHLTITVTSFIFHSTFSACPAPFLIWRLHSSCWNLLWHIIFSCWKSPNGNYKSSVFVDLIFCISGKSHFLKCLYNNFQSMGALLPQGRQISLIMIEQSHLCGLGNYISSSGEP